MLSHLFDTFKRDFSWNGTLFNEQHENNMDIVQKYQELRSKTVRRLFLEMVRGTPNGRGRKIIILEKCIYLLFIRYF